MWLETKVRMLPRFGDAVASVLLLVWVMLDIAAMCCGKVRRLLMRRFARQLVRMVRMETERPQPSGLMNAAGLGGQLFDVARIDWTVLLEQCQSPELLRWRHSPLVVAETLFFTYFGPLEAWCEANCVGRFYLWSDDRGVHRVFTDPTDRLLWSLTFNGPMPSMQELESLKTVS